MGDDVVGTVYMMSEDGEWEPLGNVSDWSITLSDDVRAADRPEWEQCYRSETIPIKFTGGVPDAVCPVDDAVRFDRLVTQQRVVVPRPTRLFYDAFGGDDKKFRNYMKALRRSIRNSRASR